MLIRDALKHGCYELQKARDTWRLACGPEGMDADLVRQYIEVISPSEVLSAQPQGESAPMRIPGGADKVEVLLRWSLPVLLDLQPGVVGGDCP